MAFWEPKVCGMKMPPSMGKSSSSSSRGSTRFTLKSNVFTHTHKKGI